ncbi:hypothetical protein EXIGLDRAFT_598303, partial [Exidia glandulosa HHB12029]
IGCIFSDHEPVTIINYCTCLALYRTDSVLVSAHASAAWITVWDNHEVANNGWKAGTNRKNTAVRTYHRWMPIHQVAADDKLRIGHNFRIRKLL